MYNFTKIISRILVLAFIITGVLSCYDETVAFANTSQITESGAGVVSNLTLTTYGGQWSNQYGVYSVSAGDGNKAIINGTQFSDFIYEANVRITNESSYSDSGLLFRASDLAIGCDAFKGYYVGIDAYNNCIRLGRMNNGYTELGSASANISANTDYKLKIQATGSNIKIYLDSVLKLEVNDNTFASGALGFRTYRSDAQFSSVFYPGIDSTETSNP